MKHIHSDSPILEIDSNHYKLLAQLAVGKKLISPTRSIRADNMSVVIPVKNNQKGIDLFLQTLVKNCDKSSYPREIIIVDNNSSAKLKISKTYPFPVKVLYCKKQGPAAARNIGASEVTGDWILFTDSDCRATKTLVSGYCTDTNECIAYAGMIEVIGRDVFSRFYRESNTLLPRYFKTSSDLVPWTIVTANCLVYREAFVESGGFNEKFKYAGGEDTDLGLRLIKLGKIKYKFDSIAQHIFDDGLDGLINRFMRYGRGQWLLHQIYKCESLSVDGSIKTALYDNADQFLNHIAESAFCWGYAAEAFKEDLIAF